MEVEDEYNIKIEERGERGRHLEGQEVTEAGWSVGVV